ncbi:MAG: hypothetical protein LUH15_08110 [Tannerellaceae bacterium]|nr:hypothetical protein [Tannerellaceae bacterium]
MTNKYCIYEKGLLLRLDNNFSVEQIITHLGGDIVSVEKNENYNLWLFHKKARITPPKPLEKNSQK